MAWNPSKNQLLFARLISFGRAIQGIREEAARLDELWNSESVSVDPDFVDARNVSKADATSMITMAQDIAKFMDNEAVPTGDRVSIISRVIIGD